MIKLPDLKDGFPGKILLLRSLMKILSPLKIISACSLDMSGLFIRSDAFSDLPIVNRDLSIKTFIMFLMPSGILSSVQAILFTINLL